MGGRQAAEGKDAGENTPSEHGDVTDVADSCFLPPYMTAPSLSVRTHRPSPACLRRTHRPSVTTTSSRHSLNADILARRSAARARSFTTPLVRLPRRICTNTALPSLERRTNVRSLLTSHHRRLTSTRPRLHHNLNQRGHSPLRATSTTLVEVTRSAMHRGR